MKLLTLVENTIYFLALVNPPSKILLLASKQPPYTRKELTSLCLRATLAALAMLLVLTSIGNVLLERIFRVQIYSLSVAGGVILFGVGLSAVKKGLFYQASEIQAMGDMSIVPLAAPLIAGPGVITAALSFASIYGIDHTIICLIMALLMNFAIMLMSAEIGRFMDRINIMGPMVRITGLIVMSVAVQMIFAGLSSWITQTFHI